MIFRRIQTFLCINSTKKSLFNCIRLANTVSKESSGQSFKKNVVERVLIKGVEEPEYLDYLKPQVPFYGLLNIKVKGYDYVVLDEYAKYIKSVCCRLCVNVCDSWPVPQKSYKMEVLKPHSTAVENVYYLKEYERIVQVKHLKAIMAPILIEILQASKPTGVTLSMIEHTLDEDEKRYIPDLKLAELEAELEEWKKPLDELQQQHR